MVNPEPRAPGDAEAMGPVAAGPMVFPPEQLYLLAMGFDVEMSPEERRLVQERQRQNRERRQAAAARAKTLFLRLLTDEQRRTFEVDQYIDVITPSKRTYRIHCNRGHAGNIQWRHHGSPQGTFCVYPGSSWEMPDYDSYIGQLLLIECDENKFLKVGVFTGTKRPNPVRRRRPFILGRK